MVSARAVRVLVAVIVFATVSAGCGGQKQTGWGPIAPTRFLALDRSHGPSNAIVAVDAKTGRREPFPVRLAKTSSDRMDITGLAVDRAGDLWVTRSNGPVCTSNVANCGPKPNSCVGQIERVDHHSGESKVVYLATPAERIDGVSPSPSAHDVAFLVAPCDGYFLNGHIRVQHLGGAAVDIGADELRCHFLSVPAWVSNGTRLAAIFHPSGPPESVRDAGPACPPTEAGGVVVLPVAPAAGLPTPAKLGDKCRPMLLTATNDTVAVMSSCGSPGEFLNGPAQLVLTDPSLHTRREWPILDCVNDASFAVDEAGDVALSSYEFCGKPEDRPHTVVFVGRDQPQQIADIPDGTLVLTHLAW